MKYDYMLSVVIPTYNHEKYIIRALDSVLMQKTNYSFEVLVGEDCSTDNTRSLLKEYETKHPGFLKVDYRDTNSRFLEKRNAVLLREKARGKYLVTLEGDDYWTSDNKIQKQIDFLEKNPKYFGVCHKCVVVDEDSKVNGEKYPQFLGKKYSLYWYLLNLFPGQLTTIMTRNYYLEPYFDDSLLKKGLSPGDRLLFFVLAIHCKLYKMNDEMSAYRHVIKGGSSYSSNYKYNFENDEKWHRELVMYAHKNSSTKGIIVAGALYYSSIRYAYKQSLIGTETYKRCKKNVPCLFIAKILLVFRRFFFLFHKNDYLR